MDAAPAGGAAAAAAPAAAGEQLPDGSGSMCSFLFLKLFFLLKIDAIKHVLLFFC